MKDILFDLCTCAGIGGNEANIARTAEKYLKNYCETSIDINSNVIAVMGNKNSTKSILLDAHIDQIGMVVTAIEHNGFLRVAKCGGMDARVLQSSTVIVHGKKDILGIVCCMPPHLSDNNEDTAVAIDNLLIDTGLTTEQVNQIVSLGDSITLFCEPKELLNSRVSVPALDNRAGVAALIKTAELLFENSDILDYSVTILLSTQEETYARGAKTGSYLTDCNESIVVDVSFANQPDIGSYCTAGKLNAGPMICVSSTLNKEISNTLISIAKEKNIPYQTEVCSGRTGTNADHISTSKNGVKTGLLSIPQRYMHTQAEIVALDDIENTAKLIASYILQGGLK